ncbi:hypothetical protein Zmor_027131 [Zophobas morio]|uniref:Uncharacterized protein n=1 Tax=Zophobas morio TaxID=2755281 RepID=A0AA38HIJ5_9CUCU|nr:hypothetical protein Zmor_027131 [Zophobas morio]
MFAIGTAFGLAKDNRGEAALVGAAMYLILCAFLVQGGIPELLYKKVLTFKGVDGTDYSALFYVKDFTGLDAEAIKAGKIAGGTYILDIGCLGGIVAGCMTA